MIDASGAASRNARAWRWLAIFVAVGPWLLPLAEHVWSAGPEATGFLGYDSPYYVANGRAIFERGNGFAYPNPSDPDPAAPVIYFHWLPWVLGVGVKFFGLDPGLWFNAIGLIAAIGCSAITLRIVETVLPDARGKWVWFLLTMWGGGLLSLASLATHPGGDWVNNAFVFDQPSGWWFPNWGRNLMLAHEAVYHWIVALAWLAALQQRWRWAWLWLAAIATTHPFTGAQHLLIFNVWLGWEALRERSRANGLRLGAFAALFATFALYYFWFLNRYVQHRHLQQGWSLQWTMPVVSIVLGVGLPAVIVAWRFAHNAGRPDGRDRFLLAASFVTLVLLKHEWFIGARQPAHFSRGYNWLPIWLLALPQGQAWWTQLRTKWPRPRLLVVSAAVIALLLSDNVLFLYREMIFGEYDRAHLTVDQREMFRWMDREKLTGVLLTVEPRVSYLAATYTATRPFYGHLANTPDLFTRWQAAKAWHERAVRGAWFDSVDSILIERTNPPANFDWTNWRELHRNHDYVLLGRRKT